MEQTEEMVMMLNQMPNPAFFVKDGIILQVNDAASRKMISVGASVAELLVTGQQEYADFQQGCLCLTLNIGGAHCSVTVTPLSDFDLFTVDQDENQAELRVMALAAQELRSPLSTVMTVADQLFPLDSLDENPTAQEQVARINRGLFQMLRIISNMSDAYIYHQNQRPRLEVRDVGSLMDEWFRESAQVIRHAGISLRFQNLSETVYSLVDAEKLERAIYNILSNAMKFTPKGGHIDAKCVRKGKMLYLTVQDSGFPGRLPANLYSSYQRSPGIEDSRFGIGLGLVLIRSAAAAHGGTVLIQQDPENGTRITVSIAIRQNGDPTVRSSVISVDYAGERDHCLVELSDSLPADLYRKENIN